MRPSGDPQIGPVGPYHHAMPPHHLPPHHMPYHVEQVPTTSHPSWHQGPHAGLPTPPPYPHHVPHPQQHAHQQHPGPQTVSYPMAQPHPQQQHHPPIPPQALAAHQQQQQQQQQQHHLQQQQQQQQRHQQQQIQQQQQRPISYSTPSPSRGPSAPTQNQKIRTEQWISNQAWPYAQSPAPPINPSVMSYHQDDRMSVLSVNTQMTNQYPESQRCYSSNGSTCENVNPELMQVNVAHAAEQALMLWSSTPDMHQRVKMAKAIRDWLREDKFAHVDQASLSKLIQKILDVIHDGLKTQNPQMPIQYFAHLFYYLLDTLRYVTVLSSTSAYLYLIIQRFSPTENGVNDFRELACQFVHPQFMIDSLRSCSNVVFQTINCIISHTKQEKWRVEFARSLKFQRLVYSLLEYFDQRIPVHFINQHVFTILRFIMSKDNALKDCIIWNSEPQREVFSKNSIIYRLNSVLLRAQQSLVGEGGQNPEHVQTVIQVIVNSFQLLSILLYNSVTIDGFVRSEGMNVICTVLQIPSPEVARAAFSFLSKISDSPALGTIPLTHMLPFLLRFISNSPDNEVLYYGTGFLSNVVANKQHVKELAIQNEAISLLYLLIQRIPRLTELKETPKRSRACDILCNCMRTLNNFLLLWVPTNNGMQIAGEKEKQQVCRFIEPEMLRKLMSCLSADDIETSGLMELRSTIIRFLQVLFRTPFVPKDGLLNIIDECRNENLVGHICAAFSWSRRQRDEPRTTATKHQLMERTINVLKVLMEQCGAERQVAECSYSIECPLNLLKDNTKQTFLHTVLLVCDKILEHCPTRADIWTIDRPMLEGLTNHQNADIAILANKLLTRFPDSDLLAGYLTSSEFF